MKLVIVKLGGSLITDKTKPYTPRLNAIHRLCKEIAKSRTENVDQKIIITTGAGSFAHYSAKRYGTSKGIKSIEDVYGASVVHYDAQRLNAIVVDSLIKHKIAAFSLTPSAIYTNKDGVFDSFNISSINTLLQNNFVPVLYGDVVLDKEQGVSILSTDTLIKELAIKIKKEYKDICVVHVGSYNGVLNKWGKVIPKVTYKNLSSIENLSMGGIIDTTGGMIFKVNEMLELTKLKIKSAIINGKKPGVLYKSLKCKVEGTLIC